MLYTIRIFQLIDLIGIVCSMLFKKRRNELWNYLTLAKWVYYFGSGASFVLSFGLYGIVEDIENDDGTLYIFIFAICIGVMLSFMQKVWSIKYNTTTLIFRNSFGFVKEYNIRELELVEKENMIEIRLNGKKIIEWPILLANSKEDIEFYKFMKTKINK